MPELTHQQKVTLLWLSGQLRGIAAPGGPEHVFWGAIRDIEARLADKALSPMTTDELIEYARDLLQR